MAACASLIACSGSDAGTPAGTGGTPSAGGSESVGGSSALGGNVATGGTTSVGGSATGGAATGGAPTTSTGGTQATVGMPNTGGTPATVGGATASGGTRPNTGGTLATGGTKTGGGTTGTGGITGGCPTGTGPGSGGACSTGGSPTATGGVPPTGGSRATGGATAAGGVAPTGGSKATGGSTSTGSCVEVTCGSHKWPCWKVPNPASSPTSVPNHQSYTDLGAGGTGAVRDNVTCLVWEKANPSAQGSWQVSSDRCAALATSNFSGFNDWRLPSRVEMASITDLHGSNGFSPIFTVTSGYYATSSYWYETITGQSTAGYEFGYGTNGFSSNAVAMASGMVARCVRGNGTGEAANVFAVEPPNHYSVSGSGADAVVTDNYTKLSWQQTFSASRMAWSAGPDYCTSQTTGGFSDWRVPTLNELTSTVNEALVGPAINRTVFPGTPYCGSTAWFWAREASAVGGTAWGINYCDGFTGWNAASATWNTFPDAYVRCVRGG